MVFLEKSAAYSLSAYSTPIQCSPYLQEPVVWDARKPFRIIPLTLLTKEFGDYHSFILFVQITLSLH